MALVIDPDVWNTANGFINVGNVEMAWKTLADAGDSYAARAYDIIAQPDSLFARLVQVQWAENASPEQIEQNFDLVALQHVSQYLADIEDSGEFRLPNTEQIEQSYSTALADHNLSQLCAVDAMFSKLDYHVNFGDISWATA